jgi:hypothetical protein
LSYKLRRNTRASENERGSDALFSLLIILISLLRIRTRKLVKTMKIQQFREGLHKLIAESVDIPPQKILDELELQCDFLRNGISDIRIRPQSDESDQKPTQNATKRLSDQPALGDRVRTNPPRPAHSRHPMFEY